MVSCVFQLPRVRPRHEAATATSDTMMEGGMQLLNRDGHSISHNSKRHYHDSFVSMNRMRQRGLLCDIVLHVSNKEIKAHKVVLASCSPYFHAMFTSKFTARHLLYSITHLLFFCRWHNNNNSCNSVHQYILPSSSLPSSLPVLGACGQMRRVSITFPLHTTLILCVQTVSCLALRLGWMALSHLNPAVIKLF